jgi:hypothetical protein
MMGVGRWVGNLRRTGQPSLAKSLKCLLGNRWANRPLKERAGPKLYQRSRNSKLFLPGCRRPPLNPSPHPNSGSLGELRLINLAAGLNQPRFLNFSSQTWRDFTAFRSDSPGSSPGFSSIHGQFA